MKTRPQRIDSEEVLMLRVLMLEIIANLHDLLVPLIQLQQLLFKLIVPNLVQHERIALKTAPRLKLFITTHRVEHTVQLHLPNPGFQRFLDIDIQTNS
jgi:hypothetical protein